MSSDVIPSARRRRRGLALLLAPVLVLSAAAAPGATALAGSCDLVSHTYTATATIDDGLTSMFTTYGQEKRWWTGGDSTYSVEVGHRIAWFFSDTLIGKVNADGSQAIDQFVNSSIAIQQGNHIVKTVTGGTPSHPTGLVPPVGDSWYWLGASHLTADGSSLDVVFLRFERFGPGIWDWGWKENVLGRLDPSSFKVRKVVHLPSASGVNWGSWISHDGDHTLVYGVEDLGWIKFMHIARVAGDDLTRPWEYWTGSGWSPNEADSSQVMYGVANEYSVAPYGDGYLLVTHDTLELFSRNIVAYVSCSPTGPFTPIGTLYSTPETGLFGSYGTANVFTYNSHEHPELRAGGSLLVSYNVNSFDNQDLYADSTIYRPRFVRVELQPQP
jgi:hypothetical protein